MIDLPQAAATFLLAAAGYLSTAKLQRVIHERREDKRRTKAVAAHEGHSPDPHPRFSRLFPNGEKDEVINKINDLILENQARRKETTENRLAHDEIMSKIADIAARLERRGI